MLGSNVLFKGQGPKLIITSSNNVDLSSLELYFSHVSSKTLSNLLNLDTFTLNAITQVQASAALRALIHVLSLTALGKLNKK